MQFPLFVRAYIFWFPIFKVDDIGSFRLPVSYLHLQLEGTIVVILPVLTRVEPGLRPVAIVETPVLEQLGDSLVRFPGTLLRLLCQQGNGKKKSG